MEPLPTHLAPRIYAMPEVKAVLFDVYGTLFISGTGDISLAEEMRNQQALTDALQQAGFSGHLEEAGERGSNLLLQEIRDTHTLLRKNGADFPEVEIRDEWKKVLGSLKQEGVLEGDISPESVIRVSVEYEFRVNPIWPMPGGVDIIRSLKGSPLQLGIVSNAQFYTQLLFPAFFDQSHPELGFAPDLCAWSCELLIAKPSIDLFRGVIERLDQQYAIRPEETLYVGNDMLKDVWTAAQAGLKTALFAGAHRSLRLREDEPQCAEREPDIILTHLAQLADIFPDD